MERVLGVDPGLTRCGLGIVEKASSRKVRLVTVTVVRTSSETPVEQRLAEIQTNMEQLIETYQPQSMAVERVFAQQNLRTVMGTAQVAGVAMVTAARRDIPVGLHTPTEVKAAVTGNGKAPKVQVQSMVQRILGLSAPPKPADAADALALAICHIWRPFTGGLNAAPGSSVGSGTGLTRAQHRWAAAERAARRRR